MTVFFIYVPETASYTIDPEKFTCQLQTRWPGVGTETQLLREGWLFYHVTRQPVDAILHPERPNTLLWYPILRPIADPSQLNQVRYLPQISDSPVLCRLNAKLGCLTIDGAGYADCAVTALWLRSWLPEGVPLFAKPEQEETAIEIKIRDTVESIVLRMRQATELTIGLNSTDAQLRTPTRILPEPEVERLVKQVLDTGR